MFYHTWKPRSKPAVFLEKSRQHASNASLAYDPSTHHMSPQFHLVHDDEFQTVNRSNSNNLPDNWRDLLATSHYSDDEQFTTPLQAKVQNDNIAVRIKLGSSSDDSSLNNNTSKRVQLVDDVDRMDVSEGAHINDISSDSLPLLSEEDENSDSHASPASEGDLDTNSSTNHNSSLTDGSEEDAGSVAQITTKSGRKILRPKRYLNTAILGLLSFQLGVPMSSKVDSLQSMSILKAQMQHDHIINELPDNTNNNIHPLTYMASQANTDVLYYHQAMKADDANFFKEAMDVEIKSFNDENIFTLMPISNKPNDKSLIPFVWSFKRKKECSW